MNIYRILTCAPVGAPICTSNTRKTASCHGIRWFHCHGMLSRSSVRRRRSRGAHHTRAPCRALTSADTVTSSQPTGRKWAQPVTRPTPTSYGPNLIPRAKILLFHRPTSPAKRHGATLQQCVFYTTTHRKETQHKIWNQGHITDNFRGTNLYRTTWRKRTRGVFFFRKKKKRKKVREDQGSSVTHVGRRTCPYDRWATLGA